MFKKEYSPVKASLSQADDMITVITRLQQNADQVEKNILEAEKLLDEDKQNDRNGVPLKRPGAVAEILSKAEMLLKDLFLDVNKAKRLHHPQVNEIELDVTHLHDRWSKDCGRFRDLYGQLHELYLSPDIDLNKLLSEKQSLIVGGDYGPSLSDVEQQITSHNILHKQMEAYRSALDSSAENSSGLQKQYADLLDVSLKRRQDLSSLYDFMHGCNKELLYLNEQQRKILKRDLSDRMIDSAGVHMEYERFKNNGLLTHEREVNRLTDDADALILKRHPGSSVIRACLEDVKSEWQRFLDLCMCQDTHLDNVEDYKKYQLNVETFIESLKRIKSTTEPSVLKNMSNHEILLQLEGEERAITRNEQRLVDLRELCTTIAPLHLRRTIANKPVSVIALCDWSTERDSVRRGDKYTLVSSPREENWEVKSSTRELKVIPGVCFLIPPPDSSAIDTVDSLSRDFADLKRTRSALQAQARTTSVEVVRVMRTATVETVPDNSKARVISSQLDRIIADLVKLEKDVLNRIRSPLQRSDPIGDLSVRIRDHERSVVALRNLEAEKSSAQRDLQPLLLEKPLGPTAATLSQKLSIANNKIDDITALTDLYNKKATAAMFLEKQFKKVDNIVSAFEDQLAADNVILDEPSIIRHHSVQIQNMSNDVASKEDDIQQLNHELEVTEQASSSLQKSFQEYCPDIRYQESEVKRLRNRYYNINIQLEHRAALLQEAANKNLEFQSAVHSIFVFMNNMPNNKVWAGDSASQIYAKQTSQMRAVEDIKRKAEDVDRLVKVSHELQSILNEYEVNSNKYRLTLGKPEINANRFQATTLAEAVQKKEREIVRLYSEMSAENYQLLNQVILAKELINKNEQTVHHVVVKQQLQLQSQQRENEEVDGMKRELAEESSRRIHAEHDLSTYSKRMMSLKSRRGVERLEEKEIVHYYRDPKLEAEVEILKKRITEEINKRSEMHTEIEFVNQKIVSRENERIVIKPKLVMKVLTEIERDPKLDVEAARIRELLFKLREEIRVYESETVRIRTEITVLEKKKPVIRERVVLKEVVKLEKDPEMLKAVISFKNQISDDSIRCKTLNDQIFHIRSQINNLERIIPSIQPKIVIKEVKRVEQDAELLKESKSLRLSLEELIRENSVLIQEYSSLQLRYTQVEAIKQKIEIKEIINEIYRIDPETEVELRRLRNELNEISRRRTSIEHEINLIMVDLKTLRSQKPKVELKEVTREVVKEERSPEVVKEIKRLNDQLIILRTKYDSTMNRVIRLRKERDEWKTERSKVEMRVVTKELIKYENDPLVEKEAERLRREVREEVQLRRTVEEHVYDLQNKYIILERQKPEERVVIHEIVRHQKDQNQILAHERLVKTLEEVIKTRRQLEVELQQMRTLVLELQGKLEHADRQKKVILETELRQIKARIYELETCPTPVEEKIVIEEVLKVERDPTVDKRITGLRTEMENEGTVITRLERDVRNLKIRIETLTKEKSVEKTIYKEIIRVEQDLTVEAERESLRKQVAQARNARVLQEEEIQRITTKITQIQTTRTNYSQEETTLTVHRDKLKKERDELLKELRRIESRKQEITVNFKHESQLLSERTEVIRQQSIKLDTEIQSLERDILEEKERIHQRESTIIELKKQVLITQNSETNTRESNRSTKITILDPETGKDMSAYDAYVEGLIDRNKYIHLQELQCSWEEITTTGPEGETTLLQDLKSGKQYSVKTALQDGRLTQYDLQRYRDGKMSISEFALLVAGEKKPVTFPDSSTTHTTSTLNSRSFYSSNSNLSTLQITSGEDLFPISGVLDVTTDSRMSVRSAMTRKLIDLDTTMRLLEAQAATGGIVDMNKKEKFSVHKAAERGLIDTTQVHKLINAQKAFTGVEDPVSKQRMSVGEAAHRGWIPNESALWFMEVQLLTGGLVDPNKAGRVGLQNAVDAKLIDASVAKQLQDESTFVKNVIDPIKKEKITYKEAMARCKRDPTTGLLLLPAASTDDTDAPSYSSFNFSKK
ncbi:envoplakin-like isoform X1 [Xyrauchen texanus]|uniref:envoplakin-like isoform X1 n=1 Tax=Xyrauchen texanus TaxID=154827 RepID=UPI002241D09A|nr:envoplakin-like isoform X1 [Xyrauchen texanus]